MVSKSIKKEFLFNYFEQRNNKIKYPKKVMTNDRKRSTGVMDKREFNSVHQIKVKDNRFYYYQTYVSA